jgi:hypothetical protein
MPSDNSVYGKIHMVLDIARSVKISSATDLRQEIKGRKPPNFMTRQYDSESDTYITGISDRVIRRTVDFCRLLNLIKDTGELTEHGREALRKTRYDDVIASQVRSYLRHSGVDLHELNEVIAKSLRSDPPDLPTQKKLWATVSNGINYSIFSRMLTLLAQCGEAKSSQSKIYLHVNER